MVNDYHKCNKNTADFGGIFITLNLNIITIMFNTKNRWIYFLALLKVTIALYSYSIS